MASSNKLESKLAATVQQRDQLAAASTAAALQTLDQQIAELRAQIEGAAQTAKRETEIAPLVEVANEGRAALADYERERMALAEAMTRHLAALASARQRMQQARAEFIAGANPLCGSALSKLLSMRVGPEEARELESDMADVLGEVEGRGGDLAGVLIADFHLSRTAADRPYQFAEVGPIDLLLNQLIAQASPDYLVRSIAAEAVTNRALAAHSF